MERKFVNGFQKTAFATPKMKAALTGAGLGSLYTGLMSEGETTKDKARDALIGAGLGGLLGSSFKKGKMFRKKPSKDEIEQMIRKATTSGFPRKV